MAQIPYVFNQLCSFLPRDIFDRLVAKFHGNASVKHYTCWNHLLVMIWAQLTNRRGLRDIVSSLQAHSDKIYRMGMGKSVSRNNISHANATRDVAIFREFAHAMMKRSSGVAVTDGILKDIGEAFRLTGFFAVDSSTVSLDLRRFRWSAPQEDCGGVKLHTMYDLMRNVPRFCLITGHEERDQSYMEDYPYEKGSFYMVDKMYFKTRGLYKIHSSGAYFVTRMKKNVVYDTVAIHPADGACVLSDETVVFTSRWAKGGFHEELRLITFYSPDNNETYQFLTNNFELDAATIALLYKYRWQIELFFKWIKQHLRITTFYGTSGNAVMIQIYVGYITYCMLALAADAQQFKGSLYELGCIMSVSLTERVHISDLLKRMGNPIGHYNDDIQGSLFDFDNLLF